MACYNCEVGDYGPVCKRCWKKLSRGQREDIKTVFNDDVEVGKHGPDAQLYWDVPGCWNLVRKKNMAIGRCFEHPEDADRERSRSPVVRPADRQRRGAAAASSDRPAYRTADRMTAAIARLRAGVEMMQNAVNEIADAAGGL